VFKVSTKHFDKRRAGAIKRNIRKWIPHLILWQTALDIIAAAGAVKFKFHPGFVLDDEVRAVASTEGVKTAAVMINPLRLMAAVKAHKDHPEALAHYLHSLGAHELAHLPHMGDGHGDTFIEEREDLGLATSRTIPRITMAAIKLLRLKEPNPCAATQAELSTTRKKLEQQTAKLAEVRKERNQLKGAAARGARIMEGVKQPDWTIVKRLQALADYHDFRLYLQGPGRALLPGGVAPETLLEWLDKRPGEVADLIIARYGESTENARSRARGSL